MIITGYGNYNLGTMEIVGPEPTTSGYVPTSQTDAGVMQPLREPAPVAEPLLNTLSLTKEQYTGQVLAYMMNKYQIDMEDPRYMKYLGMIETCQAAKKSVQQTCETIYAKIKVEGATAPPPINEVSESTIPPTVNPPPAISPPRYEETSKDEYLPPATQTTPPKTVSPTGTYVRTTDNAFTPPPTSTSDVPAVKSKTIEQQPPAAPANPPKTPEQQIPAVKTDFVEGSSSYNYLLNPPIQDLSTLQKRTNPIIPVAIGAGALLVALKLFR